MLVRDLIDDNAFLVVAIYKKILWLVSEYESIKHARKKNRSLNQIRLSNVLAVNWVKKFYLVLRLFL